MLALIGGVLARSALMQSPIGAVLAAIPRRVWIAIAIVLLIVAGYLRHEHKAGAAIAAAEKRGADAAYANVAKQARELEAKANALNARIVAEMRKRNDEEVRRIAVAADVLRLRGPGAARCTVVAGLPAATGGHLPPRGRTDAAGSQLPAGERAAVPWDWLVGRAEQADLNRGEALAWREWYVRFKAEWDRWNAESAAAATGHAR